MDSAIATSADYSSLCPGPRCVRAGDAERRGARPLHPHYRGPADRGHTHRGHGGGRRGQQT